MRAAKTHRGYIVLVIAVIALVLLVMFQQRTRTIEGTWIDLFEGSRFFEGKNLEESCGPRFLEAPWLAFYPKSGSPEKRLMQAHGQPGIFVSEYGTWPVAAYSVKFVGNQNILGLGFGHLSASPSEFEVQRMISMVPIENVRCDVRSQASTA